MAISSISISVGKSDHNGDFVYTLPLSENRILGVIGDFTSDSPIGASALLVSHLKSHADHNFAPWRNGTGQPAEIVDLVCRWANDWVKKRKKPLNTTLIVMHYDVTTSLIHFTCLGDSGLAIIGENELRFLVKGDTSGVRSTAGFLPLEREHFDIRKERVGPSETIFAYTDGLWENTSHLAEMNPESCKPFLVGLINKPSLEEVESEIQKHIFGKSNRKDDLTILAIRGAPAPRLEQEISRENRDEPDEDATRPNAPRIWAAQLEMRLDKLESKTEALSPPDQGLSPMQEQFLQALRSADGGIRDLKTELNGRVQELGDKLETKIDGRLAALNEEAENKIRELFEKSEVLAGLSDIVDRHETTLQKLEHAGDELKNRLSTDEGDFTAAAWSTFKNKVNSIEERLTKSQGMLSQERDEDRQELPVVAIETPMSPLPKSNKFISLVKYAAPVFIVLLVILYLAGYQKPFILKVLGQESGVSANGNDPTSIVENGNGDIPSEGNGPSDTAIECPQGPSWTDTAQAKPKDSWRDRFQNVSTSAAYLTILGLDEAAFREELITLGKALDGKKQDISSARPTEKTLTIGLSRPVRGKQAFELTIFNTNQNPVSWIHEFAKSTDSGPPVERVLNLWIQLSAGFNKVDGDVGDTTKGRVKEMIDTKIDLNKLKILIGLLDNDNLDPLDENTMSRVAGAFKISESNYSAQLTGLAEAIKRERSRTNAKYAQIEETISEEVFNIVVLFCQSGQPTSLEGWRQKEDRQIGPPILMVWLAAKLSLPSSDGAKEPVTQKLKIFEELDTQKIAETINQVE